MPYFRLTLTLGLALVLGLVISAPRAEAQDAKAKKTAVKGKAVAGLKTIRDKASYAIGLQIGQALKRQGLNVDPKLLARGIAETLAGTKPALSDQQIEAALAAFQREMQAQQAAKSKADAAKNTKAGAAFLAANAKKKGIKMTKSGLQYLVLKAGNGPRPKATDTVKVHYRGSLIDGTVFDASYKGKSPNVTDKPVSFAANRVIKGWTEALQLMKVGASYQLFIPANLGYGVRGAGEDIGPNSTLIFVVHLLSIERAKSPKKKPKGS